MQQSLFHETPILQISARGSNFPAEGTRSAVLTGRHGKKSESPYVDCCVLVLETLFP
jgi:hypothetical protein